MNRLQDEGMGHSQLMEKRTQPRRILLGGEVTMVCILSSIDDALVYYVYCKALGGNRLASAAPSVDASSSNRKTMLRQDDNRFDMHCTCLSSRCL